MPLPEVSAKALRKMLAAIEGVGHQAAAFGALARRAWGGSEDLAAVELLLNTTPEQREPILSAARGEGLRQPPGAGPLSLLYADAKLGGETPVELVEASTPALKKMFERAQPGGVLGVSLKILTCEDLILLGAASSRPEDLPPLVSLLRGNAGRIDGAYLKREAEAAGIFDSLKRAWTAAKAQG
jgi:hypothetical protein